MILDSIYLLINILERTLKIFAVGHLNFLGLSKELCVFFFKFSVSLKAHYCAIVRFTLEYGSVLWDPRTSRDLMIIERVKRKFLRYASFVFKFSYPPHGYTFISNDLNLPILTNRRWLSCCWFLASLLTDSIDSLSLLTGNFFRVPTRKVRNAAPYRLDILSSNYLLYFPLIRLMHLANEDLSFNI